MREKIPQAKDVKDFLSQKGYHAIPISENASGLLLISVKVNSTTGLFILDTGAGVSVVDSKHVELFNLILETAETSFTGAGAGGQGLEVVPSKGNRLEIGNHVISNFTLAVMSLEHVSQALAQLDCEEEFLGIIGVDILKPGKAIIDYSTMTLYLIGILQS
ncbi:MAG TPA: retropepsin-like aspartic protease [Chitinophagaceae bacterium]|nr:retropepsin-like aspartic protease [Chitinophagaceae bacterium]